MDKKYDFSGWATKANLLCSDGRIIRQNAFEECDGMKVPLVWNHEHNDPNAVLGHAVLKNRSDGVYAYGVFNDSDSGRAAKEASWCGDLIGRNHYRKWQDHKQDYDRWQDLLSGRPSIGYKEPSCKDYQQGKGG